MPKAQRRQARNTLRCHPMVHRKLLLQCGGGIVDVEAAAAKAAAALVHVRDVGLWHPHIK